MNVVSHKTIRIFREKHRDAASPLDRSISKEQAKKLAKRFGVSVDLFI